MVAVFFTFAVCARLPPKEMGVILGVAVLLDAFLVRLLLLPVALRLLGRWAWYVTAPLQRRGPGVGGPAWRAGTRVRGVCPATGGGWLSPRRSASASASVCRRRSRSSSARSW